ncbi:MAG: chloride channel protein, partial [Acetobacteraceae bacterium]|nr:chloride channel protein [Acetobacteraceae bacterium]
FAALGCLAIPFPELLGNGKDVVQRSFGGALPITLLLPLLILRPLATGACLGTGAPGGLFTPTMTLGALVGAALGWLWGLVWPTAGLPGAYALMGSAAVLAAATQGPISAIALAVELTHHLDTSIVPVLTAVSGATIVARHFEVRSIYSGRIHSGRHAGETGNRASHDEGGFETISAAAPYAAVLRAVLRTGNDATPIYVLDENEETLGTLARAKVMQPDESVMPLEIATAADFIG